MTRIDEFIQSLGLDLEPRTLLYIFLALAVMSLISLGIIAFSSLKTKEKKVKEKKPKEPKPKEDLEAEKPEEDLPKEIVPLTDEEPVKALSDKDYEVDAVYEDTVQLPDLPEQIEAAINEEEKVDFEPLEIEPEEPALEEINEEPLSNTVYLEPIVEPEVEEALQDIEEVTPEVEELEPEIVEEPEVKPLPPIYSSVYLEPQASTIEPVKEPEIEEIKESEPKAEIPSHDIKDYEEELINTITPEIYPDIVEEIQKHRDDDPNVYDMSIPFDPVLSGEKGMPGKIIPTEEPKKTINIDDNSLTREIVLTADVLKERLAKLQGKQATTPSPSPKKDDGDELENILKQVGIEEPENPMTKLSDEEKTILGR